MPNESGSPTLVNVYIDGYNFYYSISKRDEPELLPLGWCNFGTLAAGLSKRSGQQPASVQSSTTRRECLPIFNFAAEKSSGSNSGSTR